MDAKRNFFVIALLILTLIIWQEWQNDQTLNKKEENTKNSIVNTEKNTKNNLNIKNNTKTTDDFFIIKSDVLLLKIKKTTGEIEEAKLLTYLKDLKSKEPIKLLYNTNNSFCKSNSGFTYNNSLKNVNSINNVIYKTYDNKDTYELQNNHDELTVPLYFMDAEKTEYIKTYTIKRGEFAININYNIKNNSNHPIMINMYGELSNSSNHSEKNKISEKYLGSNEDTYIAYSSTSNKYKKYSFNNIKDKKISINTNHGWIAILQQYFATAWLPLLPDNILIYTNNHSNTNQITIGFKSENISILPGDTKVFKLILWLGPKIQNKMAEAGDYLNLVVDYGWLWFISQPLFYLLQFIHKFTHNWGTAIIAITIIIRILMYPLTKAQYTSMAKMRILQPKLANLQKHFKNDKNKYHKEIMELYKKEKVNPLGGCLPLIIQMPIFLALYYMLSGSVELRHAKFTLWINDLSSQDPYYILPIIMGLTIFCIHKLSPSTITDPIQKKIINIMLLAFTIFFLWFPSGLVLYYIVSNLITIMQQQIIYQGLEKKGLYNKN